MHIRCTYFVRTHVTMTVLGLAGYLSALDAAYDGCGLNTRNVSRADFYAKCGQVAAELGRFDSSEFAYCHMCG